MIRLETPLGQDEVKGLKIGDAVLLSGTIFTARDRAHIFFLGNDFDKIRDSVIYHCGPIVKQEGDDYGIVAAGPTTSSRMNKYTPGLISRYGIKAVIGKGGMDHEVLEALRGKAVYLSAVGGAGLVYADSVTKVVDVHKPEFGMPESIWQLKVKDFPAVVTMDSRGDSLHEIVLKGSTNALRRILSDDKPGIP